MNTDTTWRLSSTQRRLALTAHVILSVGWIGVEASLLTLAVLALTTGDEATVRAAYRATGLIGGAFIAPASFGSLLTGVLLSVGTRWGLVRYYWVAVKLVIGVVLTIGTNAVLATFLRMAAERAAHLDPLGELGQRVLDGSVVSTSLLLVATVLSIYKPWGRTRYGMRQLTTIKGAAR